MAQADQTVQNATFPTVRADINNNLAALFTDSSGGTAPSVTVAFQDWIDTSGASPLWKKRNAANNAWITLGTISASTIAFEGTLPSQTGNAGEYLTTDGTVASWGAIPPGSSKEVFTSSGTWVKPTAGTIALVTIWGGGGGGACVQRLFQLSDLPGSAAVTIGAGGVAIASSSNAVGNGGGTSSFGSLMSAYGGGGGAQVAAYGGGGGGSLGAGDTGGSAAGGSGHSSTLSGGSGFFTGKGDYGGAGGGGSGSGATAFWGGGGGGGCANGSAAQNAGGDSLNGGDGSTSNTGTAASVPGGGGGASNQTAVASGAGGAGLCIVYIW